MNMHIKKTGKGCIVLALCVLSVFLFCTWQARLPAQAASLSEDKQALQKMEEQLSVLKDKRKEAEKSYEAARLAYDDAEYDYTVAHEKKLALDEEIAALDLEVTQTGELLALYTEQIAYYTDAIAEKEVEIAKRNQIFLNRVKVNYEESFVSYLELVLSSQSFSDLLYRVDVVAALLDYDKKVLAELDTAKKEMTEMQNEYAALQYKAQETYDSLVGQLAQLEARREESEFLLLELDEKMEAALKNKELAADIKAEIVASYETKQAQCAEAEAEIEAKIRIAQEEERRRREEEEKRKQEEQAAQKPSQETTAPEKEPPEEPTVTGRLGWPTEPAYTRISSEYGERISPINGKKEVHNGIDIPCAYQSAIYAADGGTVIISEYHYSYGNYVVIDHGNGLSTLYAHNTTNIVGVGDVVAKGQQIAKAGSTGDSKGNHCHFCVRINGKHTDPMPYLTN